MCTRPQIRAPTIAPAADSVTIRRMNHTQLEARFTRAWALLPGGVTRRYGGGWPVFFKTGPGRQLQTVGFNQ